MAWFVVSAVLVLAGVLAAHRVAVTPSSAEVSTVRGLALAAGVCAVFWGLVAALVGVVVR